MQSEDAVKGVSFVRVRWYIHDDDDDDDDDDNDELQMTVGWGMKTEQIAKATNIGYTPLHKHVIRKYATTQGKCLPFW